MTVPGWERAACAEVPHCAHRTDEGERPTRTQARHSLGEQSVTAAPTQPVESCPTGRPRAPTRLPARNRQVGHTHSFPANAQLGPETDFTEKQITPTSLVALRSADTQRRHEETGNGRKRNTQTGSRPLEAGDDAAGASSLRKLPL